MAESAVFDCPECGHEHYRHGYGPACSICDCDGSPALPATVKRVDLFGHVEDTYATEGELNGWRAQQAHLVGKQGGLL